MKLRFFAAVAMYRNFSEALCFLSNDEDEVRDRAKKIVKHYVGVARCRVQAFYLTRDAAKEVWFEIGKAMAAAGYPSHLVNDTGWIPATWAGDYDAGYKVGWKEGLLRK